jgi:hypothetical protein
VDCGALVSDAFIAVVGGLYTAPGIIVLSSPELGHWAHQMVHDREESDTRYWYFDGTTCEQVGPTGAHRAIDHYLSP